MTHWWNCFGHGDAPDGSDNDFDFPEAKNLIGLWDFNDGAKTKDTGLGDGIAQNGHLHGNANISNGALHLDGNGDYFDVSGTDAPFDLDRGTVMVEFTQDAHVSTSPDALVNRGEYDDRVTEGYFGIQVTQDGRVQVQHMDGANSVTLSTGAHFFAAGDDVRVAYSFDAETGGSFVVENLSAGTSYNVDHHVTGLSMDIGDNDDENFTFGAREVDDGRYDHFFNGDINYVAYFDDDLIKGESDGVVSGTAGNDLIDLNYTGDPDGDLVDAGDAILPEAGPNDDVIEAGAGNDTVWAGLGNDDVQGGAGDDKIYGESGNDTLTGGDGNDSIRGGDGNDMINTAGLAPLSDYGYPGLVPQDPDPNNDRDFADGGAGDDYIFTGDDRDTITGGTGNDTLDGGLDDDNISGGDGNDLIIGGHGSDLINGGAGNDTIYGGTTIPELNLPDENNGPFNDLRPDNARDTIHGGEGNDWIDGEDDADLLYGDGGNDTILGGIDNDTIYGGSGDDSLIGGDGADQISGDDGNDLIDLGGDVTADYADHASGGADRDTFIGGGAGDVVVGGETGDDFDTLNLTGLGPLRVVYTDGDPASESGTVEFLDGPDGAVTGTLTFSEIENVVPCFTPGTLIATPKGERLVQDLQPGDKVITRDNGIQEIRWIGAKKLDWKGLALAPHLKPILVRAGSLGNGLPERDMMVSPNHRVLVANDRTALYFEEREVLAAAKHLVNNRGIHEVEVMGATYIHFMFDNHEVVLSNGAWTESFQPGDYTLEGIGNSQRSEILDLFPELETTEGREAYQSARRTLKKHEARLLID